MNDFNYDNEIIEISDNDDTIEKYEAEQSQNDESEKNKSKKKKTKKEKKSLKEKWRGLPRKKKVIIIVLPLIILLAIGVAVAYFLFFKNEKPIEVEEEAVIVLKDNYRYENGKLVFLDKSDRSIGTYECTLKDVDKCYVAKNAITEDNFERVISVNENNEEIEKNSQIYLDNFVFINDNEEIFLYDLKNRESLLTIKLFKAYATEKNLLVIKNEINKYGLIEITNDGFEYLIRPSYDYLGIINTKLGYLLAKDKDVNYIIDTTGKKLSKNILADTQSVNDKLIVAVKNKSYNLYTYDFNEVISDYDYIGLHDDVISLVKSNRLYLLDNNLNKLYEDGIRLESKDYIKRYVYDSDNKLKETKKSYEISISNNMASININDNIKNINLNEGIVSSNYDYLSYFDGKLYFYSDIEKTDVLGTYNCNNKNDIVDYNSSLNKCILYSKEDLYSGIYNNEYVIIDDNNEIESPNYYLYSLKEKKVKGTYSELTIVKESELNTTIKSIYTSSSYFIAKTATGNNKNNYGVFEINSDTVAGKIDFKYKSIEQINDYYLLIHVDDSYSICNSSFKKISDEFNYIELFDDYYVGISKDKLNIYSYTSKVGILENDITVTSNSFKIDFTDGFKITIDDTDYEYDKSGKTKEVLIDEE